MTDTIEPDVAEARRALGDQQRAQMKASLAAMMETPAQRALREARVALGLLEDYHRARMNAALADQRAIVEDLEAQCKQEAKRGY